MGGWLFLFLLAGGFLDSSSLVVRSPILGEFFWCGCGAAVTLDSGIRVWLILASCFAFPPRWVFLGFLLMLAWAPPPFDGSASRLRGTGAVCFQGFIYRICVCFVAAFFRSCWMPFASVDLDSFVLELMFPVSIQETTISWLFLFLITYLVTKYSTPKNMGLKCEFQAIWTEKPNFQV